eukprot:CAMPEP_0181393368 /NCGR_PEP_ID=MMETSP1106-20121128/27147_1 /TAXON_ID=81844 /ORGANISM="Mantoniella antarctica, Strain SL-175" /LENGTH=74 /DNA_ID=CAMNT_0023514673 /DNA_START=193 /DNA_END=412 /DNA_ORIENTATION=+
MSTKGVVSSAGMISSAGAAGAAAVTVFVAGATLSDGSKFTITSSEVHGSSGTSNTMAALGSTSVAVASDGLPIG